MRSGGILCLVYLRDRVRLIEKNGNGEDIVLDVLLSCGISYLRQAGELLITAAVKSHGVTCLCQDPVHNKAYRVQAYRVTE